MMMMMMMMMLFGMKSNHKGSGTGAENYWVGLSRLARLQSSRVAYRRFGLR